MNSISLYKTKDSDKVCKLFKAYPNLFPEVESELVKKDLKQPSTDQHFKYVYTKDDQVVGFSSLTKCVGSAYSWEIHWLVVDPKYKRQGIATNLIKKIIDKAKELGLPQLFVETCSCEGEKPARNFYSSIGFKQSAKIPNFYGEGHSKIIYRKVVK
jgi:N-acetylglutamate synthase-like GNAT family acetyltransferase